MTSLIKTLVLLVFAAMGGYALYKVWQAFAPLLSAAGRVTSAADNVAAGVQSAVGSITSSAEDISSGVGAIKGFVADPVGSVWNSLFGPSTPPPPPTPYADQLEAATANFPTSSTGFFGLPTNLEAGIDPQDTFAGVTPDTTGLSSASYIPDSWSQQPVIQTGFFGQPL